MKGVIPLVLEKSQHIPNGTLLPFAGFQEHGQHQHAQTIYRQIGAHILQCCCNARETGLLCAKKMLTVILI